MSKKVTNKTRRNDWKQERDDNIKYTGKSLCEELISMSSLADDSKFRESFCETMELFDNTTIKHLLDWMDNFVMRVTDHFNDNMNKV